MQATTASFPYSGIEQADIQPGNCNVEMNSPPKEQRMSHSEDATSFFQTHIRFLEGHIKELQAEKKELKSKKEALQLRVKILAESDQTKTKFLYKKLPILLVDILESLVDEFKKSPELLDELKRELKDNNDDLTLSQIARKLNSRMELESMGEELESLDVEFGFTLLYPKEHEIKKRERLRDILADIQTLEKFLEIDLSPHAGRLDLKMASHAECTESKAKQSSSLACAASNVMVAGKISLKTIWSLYGFALKASPLAGGIVVTMAPRLILQLIKMLIL